MLGKLWDLFGLGVFLALLTDVLIYGLPQRERPRERREREREEARA
jgi:hypothetical protein